MVNKYIYIENMPFVLEDIVETREDFTFFEEGDLDNI